LKFRSRVHIWFTRPFRKPGFRKSGGTRHLLMSFKSEGLFRSQAKATKGKIGE